MGGYLTVVEPLVVIHRVGTSSFEMALTLAVYNRSLEIAAGQSDQAQALTMRLFLYQSVLSCLCAFLSIVPRNRLARRFGQRVLLLTPQLGSLLGMTFLLLFLLVRLPLEVLYLGTVVYGLSGGSPGFWSAVVSLAALGSEQGRHTLKLNTVDFFSGLAGVAGGLMSGYAYRLDHRGVALVGMAMSLTAFCVLYSALLPSYPDSTTAESQPLVPIQRGIRKIEGSVGMTIMAILIFAFGMCGAEEVLCLYVLKPPLSWDSVWVGYGNAATNAMYLTSFLGVLLLSRYMEDTALVLLGIVSNCTGMAMMAFATEMMMFACVPMPTLKAQLSKILDADRYSTSACTFNGHTNGTGLFIHRAQVIPGSTILINCV
uniref:Uncharacterized protein n=1 Tax=Denticeps clupeoides TaxID=299321 RepID=A0AAY4EPK2_9TELE